MTKTALNPGRQVFLPVADTCTADTDEPGAFPLDAPVLKSAGSQVKDLRSLFFVEKYSVHVASVVELVLG